MQIAAVSGIFGVMMAIGGDRWNGTLPYLFGTPANRIVLFFGRAFIHILDGILGVVIGFAWGVLLLRLGSGSNESRPAGLDHPGHHPEHLRAWAC